MSFEPTADSQCQEVDTPTYKKKLCKLSRAVTANITTIVHISVKKITTIEDGVSFKAASSRYIHYQSSEKQRCLGTEFLCMYSRLHNKHSSICLKISFVL